MAFKINWSEKAQSDRLGILEYWIDRNKSNIFAIKLNQPFEERIELLSQYPNVGRKTNMKNIRVLIVRDYWILYRINLKSISIASVFDVRQNPGKIKRLGR